VHPVPEPRLLQTRSLDAPVTFAAPRDRMTWEARASALRRQILAAAGLWADPALQPRRPPAAEIFEARLHPELGYSVEKVCLESLPGHLVTGNLYRPLGLTGPRPAVLNPHGHWPGGRLHHDALGSTAMRCIALARMGYVALCHDMVGYGDSAGLPHAWDGPRPWLWGAGALGLQLWNAIRALDLLCGLPDVDGGRIGCTGESGGGTQTFLLTAVDPRVRVAAPVNMVSAHMQGGCACENAPGLRLDTGNVEIAALCAPRPLLLVSATGDWTADTPAVEFPAIASVYGLFGARERVATVQVDAPHNFNGQSRQAVYRFLSRWLPAGPAAAGWQDAEQGVAGPDPDADLRVFARRPAPQRPEGEAAVRAVVTALAAPPDGGALDWLLAANGIGPVAPAAVVARDAGPDTLWLGRRGCAERFVARRSDPAAPVRLLAADGTRWGIWPFGTGPGAPWAASGRAAGTAFFLCYNRSDAAWQAQDVLTALAWQGGRVAGLEADAGCAVAAALARAVAGAAIGHLKLAIGPEWADPDPEAPWLAPRAYLPGALRAGGLGGLLALAAPAPIDIEAGEAAGCPALQAAAAAYARVGASTAWRVR